MPKINPAQAQILVSEKELAAKSPYASDKDAKRNTGSRKSQIRDDVAQLRKSLQQAKNEVSSLKDKERIRRESTPTFFVGEDSLDLVYTGQIAGKSATRHEPIINDVNMARLIPILTPIVSVMNAALRAQDLQPRPYMDESGKKQVLLDGEPVYKTNALAKAQIAYSALLANPEVVEQLEKLNDAISRTYSNLGVEPKDVRTHTLRRALDRAPVFGSFNQLPQLGDGEFSPITLSGDDPHDVETVPDRS